MASSGSVGQGDGALALGHGHVVGVDHAPHALAHHVEVVQLGIDEGAGVEGGGVLGGEALGDDQLGVGLDHVVLLQEGLFGQLPVDRKPEGVPPLGAHGLDLPGVEDAGEGLDALRRGGASSSRLIHAQPPQSSQRTGTRSICPGSRLCSEKDFFLEMNVFLPSRP